MAADDDLVAAAQELKRWGLTAPSWIIRPDDVPEPPEWPPEVLARFEAEFARGFGLPGHGPPN